MNMKKRKAFTLMETIVTMVIYAVILFMITNIILLNARLSLQLKMRSRIRNELSQITFLIKRDIRNASFISSEEPSSNCNGSSCSISYSDTSLNWSYDSNDKQIIKTKIESGNPTTEYISGEYLSIDSVTFSMISDPDSQSGRATLILTIKAQGKNPEWKITNQVVQEIISTRNYNLGI